MEILKRLPIKYCGELHQVKLINFSVDKAEVRSLLPPELEPLDFNGRALISMVNVKLRKMHPAFIPASLSFNYQHIGFRLLIDDKKYNQGDAKGIYFIRSFTDKPLIVLGGRFLTNYNLEQGAILNEGANFSLRQKDKFLTYEIHSGDPEAKSSQLKEMIGSLDRAYSHIAGKLVRVQIMREKWPIEWLNCQSFQTNFFRTAKFEGAFQVQEMISYKWLPPIPILP